MFKDALVLLCFYLVYRFIRNLFSPAPVQQAPVQEYKSYKKPGEVEITSMPGDQHNARKKEDPGEYIDYKEV
jgi:hypothetical protein